MDQFLGIDLDLVSHQASLLKLTIVTTRRYQRCGTFRKTQIPSGKMVDGATTPAQTQALNATMIGTVALLQTTPAGEKNILEGALRGRRR